MAGVSEGVICFVDILHNLSNWQSAAQASTDCWSPEGWLKPRQACRPHTTQSETRCHIKSDVQSGSASPGHHRPYSALAFALSDRHSTDTPSVPPGDDPQNVTYAHVATSLCSQSCPHKKANARHAILRALVLLQMLRFLLNPKRYPPAKLDNQSVPVARFCQQKSCHSQLSTEL